MDTELVPAIVMDIEFILTIIIGAVIPLIVLLATLRTQNKIASESAKQLRTQHEENILNLKTYYESQLSLMETRNRIQVMPYFIIKEIGTEVDKRNNNLIFALTVKNVGNSVATNLTEHVLDGEDFAFHKKSHFAYFWHEPATLNRNVVEQTETIQFKVGRQQLLDAHTADDLVVIPLHFDDINSIAYKQEISFFYSDGSSTISRFHSSTPEVIENS